MYENIQTFSFSNIDKFSTAGLVTRMTTDVTNVQNAYQMIIRSVVRSTSHDDLQYYNVCNNKSEIKYYISCCTYIFRICTFLYYI